MICEKCGAVLPDDATFCGECGAKVIKAKKNPAALEKARAEAKRFKITSVILACLCVALGIGWVVTTHDPYRTLDQYEQEATDFERAGIELTGMYVVGEDPELPEGRYNIYPPEGESYMDVRVYETKEAAQKRYDKDYNSLALSDVYSMTRGLKLKTGQIVVIEYGSAFFELVSETPADTTEADAAETDAAEADTAQPDAAEADTAGAAEDGSAEAPADNTDE